MPKAKRTNQDNAVLVGLYNLNLKFMLGSISCVGRITPRISGAVRLLCVNVEFYS